MAGSRIHKEEDRRALIAIIEGERNRTSMIHRLLILHEIDGLIEGEELKVVGRQVFKLFLERIQRKPEPVDLRCGTHVLILDDRKSPELHGFAA